jgi:Ca2+-binding EF-hand superfamily protein
MRKLVLGMSALALVASAAAFAQEADDTRVAAAESATPSFTTLDADADGRVSAIEAANNSRVAAAFTSADANRDGYLSKAEYAQVEKSASSAAPRPSAPPATDSQAVPTPR